MADLQYVIDVAASMPAGEKTIAQLDALAANLVGAGVGADTLHDAMALVSNSLDAARSASVAANAALSAGAAEMRALEKAAAQAGKERDKAAKLGVVPPEVNASVEAASAAIADHALKLDRLKSTAKAAAAEEKALATTLANSKQALAAGSAALAEREAAEKKATAAQEKALKTAEELTGTGKFRKLQEAMSTSEGQALLLAQGVKVAAGALLGLSLAVVAVTGALIAGTLAIANWAVGLADAKREAGLHDQAAEALGANLAGLNELFASLEAETGLSSAKLGALTKKLREAGIESGAMAGTLRDAALAERALGDGGADDFIADIKASKGAVTGLTNEVRGKLGVIVSKQMLGLSAQSETFKKNIGGLFGDLNIEPVLNGLQRLVALFDENTAAGAAIKFLFESVFQPLINQADAAATAVEAFALGFLIGLTKLYIAVKPAIKAVSELFGFEDTSLTDVLGSAKAAGELLAPVVVGLAVAFGAIVAVVGLAVGVLVGLAVAVIALPVLFIEAARAVGDAFYQGIAKVVAYLTGVPAELHTTGGLMMQGLADGIVGAAGTVVAAITGAVKGAISSAKQLLGIHSPSKVFADIGGYTGEGFAMGVDDSADAAQDAMADMVAPPEPGSITAAAVKASAPSAAAAGADASGAGAAGGAAGKGWVGNLIANFPNVTDAAGLKEAVEEIVTKMQEGDAASLGAEPAPA